LEDDREIPRFGSTPTLSRASESADALPSATSPLESLLVGLEVVKVGWADSDRLLAFLFPLTGAVRGLDDLGFSGDDFRKFSLSFSSLEIDLGKITVKIIV
jgi:hypothetical protein